MPYDRDYAFLLDNLWITVVGCGGTGGFVAEGLGHFFQGREANIVLGDHDRVEPHNLLRQGFYAAVAVPFKRDLRVIRGRLPGRPLGGSRERKHEPPHLRPRGGVLCGFPRGEAEDEGGRWRRGSVGQCCKGEVVL